MTHTLLHKLLWELQTHYAYGFLLTLGKMRMMPLSAPTALQTCLAGNTVAGLSTSWRNMRCFPIMQGMVRVENGFPSAD